VFRADHREPEAGGSRLISAGNFSHPSIARRSQGHAYIGHAGSGKTALLRAWADGRVSRNRLAVVQVQRDQPGLKAFWLASSGHPEGRTARPAKTRAGRDHPASAQGRSPTGFRRRLAEHRDRTFMRHRRSARADLAGSALTTADADCWRSSPPHVHRILASRSSLHATASQAPPGGDLAEIRTAVCVLRSARTASSWRPRASPCRRLGPRRLNQRRRWARACGSRRSHGQPPDHERIVAAFSGSNRTVGRVLLAGDAGDSHPRSS